MDECRVGRVTLSHEVRGDGAPVVFLHHGIADRSVWEPQWSSFAPGRTLVRCDFAGFGESPIGQLPLTPARDVAALLDTLGITDAVVVGASMGGRVALELAVGRPDLVHALVLVAPALPGVDWSQAMRDYGAAEDDAVAAGDLARGHRGESADVGRRARSSRGGRRAHLQGSRRRHAAPRPRGADAPVGGARGGAARTRPR